MAASEMGGGVADGDEVFEPALAHPEKISTAAISGAAILIRLL